MADCAHTFQPGEIVDITIRGVRVVEARSDGSVTINAEARDGGPASWRMPPQAKVERVAPENWPPQPSDLWRGHPRDESDDEGVAA